MRSASDKQTLKLQLKISVLATKPMSHIMKLRHCNLQLPTELSRSLCNLLSGSSFDLYAVVLRHCNGFNTDPWCLEQLWKLWKDTQRERVWEQNESVWMWEKIDWMIFHTWTVAISSSPYRCKTFTIDAIQFFSERNLTGGISSSVENCNGPRHPRKSWSSGCGAVVKNTCAVIWKSLVQTLYALDLFSLDSMPNRDVSLIRPLVVLHCRVSS